MSLGVAGRIWNGSLVVVICFSLTTGVLFVYIAFVYIAFHVAAASMSRVIDHDAA